MPVSETTGASSWHGSGVNLVYLLRLSSANDMVEPTPFKAISPAIQARRFLARAQQFQIVAMDLADMDGPEPNWPKWFLVTHAIELAIRPFIVSRRDLDNPPPMLEPANYDLVSLYDYAVQYGLVRNSHVTEKMPSYRNCIRSSTPAIQKTTVSG